MEPYRVICITSPALKVIVQFRTSIAASVRLDGHVGYKVHRLQQVSHILGQEQNNNSPLLVDIQDTLHVMRSYIIPNESPRLPPTFHASWAHDEVAPHG